MRRVERWRWRPDLGAGVEVFVRAHLTGSTTWPRDGIGGERVHEVVFRPTFLDAEVPRRGVVNSRDIVAMVEPASKWEALEAMLAEPLRVGPRPAVQWAETYDHRRGQGLKFPDPESAAAHLEALGWSVTPPAPEPVLTVTGPARFYAAERHWFGRSSDWVVRERINHVGGWREVSLGMSEIEARRKAGELNGDRP